MKKCIINFHFGERYSYFKLQKKSFIYNSDYDFILITDQIEKNYIEKNIKYIKYTIEDINNLIQDKIHKNLSIISGNIRKFCDYKIMFGILFEDILKEYEWYGWVDSDVVLGNLNDYINKEMFNQAEIISNISRHPGCGAECGHKSCPENLFGPFMLLKNNSKIKNLYKNIPNIYEMLNHYVLHAIEENFLLQVCRELDIKIAHTYSNKIQQPLPLVRFPRQARVPAKWQNGKLIFYGFRDKKFYSEEYLLENGDEGLLVHIRKNHQVSPKTGMIY